MKKCKNCGCSAKQIVKDFDTKKGVIVKNVISFYCKKCKEDWIEADQLLRVTDSLRNISILFRPDEKLLDEYELSKKYFDVHDSRIDLKDSIVIGRYSVLPYYKELNKDLKKQNSRLINSYKEHKYVADFEYYNDIKDLTPKTYFSFSEISDYDGPFVVKGKTNSRKFDWDSKMFAKTKKAAIEIACDLKNDSLIGPQDVIIREYVKLKELEIGINGLPFSNEWRFFCYKDKIISYGFYWVISEKKGVISQKAIDLVNEVIKRVKNKVNFFVVDVAERENGDWIVIELNDGQMSGLSGNDPQELYSNLKKAIDAEISFNYHKKTVLEHLKEANEKLKNMTPKEVAAMFENSIRGDKITGSQYKILERFILSGDENISDLHSVGFFDEGTLKMANQEMIDFLEGTFPVDQYGDIGTYEGWSLRSLFLQAMVIGSKIK